MLRRILNWGQLRDDIMALIRRAPWREAVTYRDTWPHEYVVVKKDGQEDPSGSIL